MKIKTILFAVCLSLATTATLRAQTTVDTNVLSALPAPLKAVLDYVPTIDLTDTNLAACKLELRIGTSSAPNPKVSGVFSDAQIQYNLKTNFTFTVDIVSGNIGGIVDDFNAEFGYRRVLGNFAINPFIGAGYTFSGHGVTANPGLLLEIFPVRGNRLGLFASIEYDIQVTGANSGKNAGVVKGGANYAF